MIVSLVIMIPFLIMAVVFLNGKGGALIAGYNTMNDEEKAEVDEPALCRFMGKVMLGVCVSLVMFGVGDLTGSKVLGVMGSLLLVTSTIVAVVYGNTKKRFRKG